VSDASIAPAIAEQWLAQTLLADGQLAALVADRIYSLVAPQSAAYPLVVYAELAGADTEALGMIRTLTQLTYAVKAIGATASLLPIDPIAKRIDTLLQGAQAALPGGLIEGCTRRSITVLGAPAQGVQYRQIVQTYQIYLKEG
jgi:hypothetical protein